MIERIFDEHIVGGKVVNEFTIGTMTVNRTQTR